MTSSDIEERLSAVEERLGMESGLRAASDRDLSDITQALRAQRHLIQALSITQGEHTQTLQDQNETLRAHTQSLTTAHHKLDQIIHLLQTLAEGETPQT